MSTNIANTYDVCMNKAKELYVRVSKTWADVHSCDLQGCLLYGSTTTKEGLKP